MGKRMKNIFWDAEFTGLKQDADLISIGFVSEDDEELYVQCYGYDARKADEWVEKNVIAKLSPNDWFLKDEATRIISNYLKNIAGDGKVLMISDCLAYDWVLFNELFGGAMNIPDYVYYIPMDLSTALYLDHIDPDINREEFAGIKNKDQKHTALWDARVIKLCWEKLDGTKLDKEIVKDLNILGGVPRKAKGDPFKLARGLFEISREECEEI